MLNLVFTELVSILIPPSAIAKRKKKTHLILNRYNKKGFIPPLSSTENQNTRSRKKNPRLIFNYYKKNPPKKGFSPSLSPTIKIFSIAKKHFFNYYKSKKKFFCCQNCFFYVIPNTKKNLRKENKFYPRYLVIKFKIFAILFAKMAFFRRKSLFLG